MSEPDDWNGSALPKGYTLGREGVAIDQVADCRVDMNGGDPLIEVQVLDGYPVYLATADLKALLWLLRRASK